MYYGTTQIKKWSRRFEASRIPKGIDGGIQTAGSYPGRARNGDELWADLEVALAQIPGRKRLNLHAIYLESATSFAMQKHPLVLWPFHGIFGSGATLDEAFGLIVPRRKLPRFWSRSCQWVERSNPSLLRGPCIKTQATRFPHAYYTHGICDESALYSIV